MKPGEVDSLVENLFDGFYQVDADRRIVFWNKAAEKITGHTKAGIIGRLCHDDLLQHVDEGGRSLCQGQCPLAKSLVDGQSRENLVYLRHKEGYRLPVEIRVVPLRDDNGAVTGAAEIFRVAAGRPLEDGKMRELARLAFVDTLTGLRNRQYIELKLKERLTTAAGSPGGSFGVIKLEIASLREINDEYGEEVGNMALKVAGQTLAANIDATDACGRWYGGRFILLTGADRKATLLNWSTKLKALIEQSTIPDYPEVQLTVNAGGVSQHGEASAERLMRRVEDQLRQSRSAANGISIED